MKKCPFCAEEIKDEAIVCKHCGRDLDNVKNIIPAEKNKLINKITEYTSKGYMLVFSSDDRAILERPYPFSPVLFISLLLFGFVGGLIYGFYRSFKRVKVHLFLNPDGTILEVGETLSAWGKRVLKEKRFVNVFFSVIISLILFMNILFIIAAGVSTDPSVKSEGLLTFIITAIIFSLIDFLLIKNSIALSKKIKDIK